MVLAPIPVREQFNEVQQEEINRLFLSGKTQVEMATIFNVPRCTIMKLCRHLDLHRTPQQAQKSRFDPLFVEQVKKLRGEGKPILEIAASTNRSSSAVCRVLQKIGDDLPKDVFDEQQICADYVSGRTMLWIAEQNDASVHIIKRILIRSGVKIRPAPMSGGSKIRIINIDLPKFVDGKEWFAAAYEKYGMSSIAKFLGRSVGFVATKLRKFGIKTFSLSERAMQLNPEAVLKDYSELGSMNKVARKQDCTITAVKNLLGRHHVVPATASEILSGEGNPFFGKEHSVEVIQKCTEAGAIGSNKFWQEHPEFVEVIKQKQREIWSDLGRRARYSEMVSRLRKEGKIQSRRGVLQTRFGEIPFDSSYEASFIELCEKRKEVVHLERDFDLIEYEYDGKRLYVPDFRLWLVNGDFLVVEIKADWWAKQPKEQEKILSGFGRFRDKFMVVAKDLKEVEDRINLLSSPLDFDFNRVEIKEVGSKEYDDFYATFHYMGRTGRRGYTLGAKLEGKLIAVATVGSVTRNEMAEKQDLSPTEVRELVRFCIHPDFHKKNFGSWFLSRMTAEYQKWNPEVKLLISFADQTQGHVGTIYAAANWQLDGETRSSYHYVDGKKDRVHKKTIYDRAHLEGVNEGQYAKFQNLIKVFEAPKKRWLLWL